MAQNDELLAIRIPRPLKDGLDYKYPDVSERNNVIRALIKKLLDGSIVLKSYEVEQRS